jgi:hypothetical protein
MTETREINGRTYRAIPTHSFDGTNGFRYEMKVRTKTGWTWRTMNGHGRAHRNITKIAAAFREPAQ